MHLSSISRWWIFAIAIWSWIANSSTHWRNSNVTRYSRRWNGTNASQSECRWAKNWRKSRRYRNRETSVTYGQVPPRNILISSISMVLEGGIESFLNGTWKNFNDIPCKVEIIESVNLLEMNKERTQDCFTIVHQMPIRNVLLANFIQIFYTAILISL